eukprot:COSAG02_NODE_4915_length_4837_cov_6.226467_2_plen_271_part_00
MYSTTRRPSRASMPPKKRQAVAAGQRTLSFARDGRLTAKGAHQPTLRSLLSGQQRRHRGAALAPRGTPAAQSEVERARTADAIVATQSAGDMTSSAMAAGGDDDTDNSDAGLPPVLPASAAATSQANAQSPRRTNSAAARTLDSYLPEHAARAAELERVDWSAMAATEKQRRPAIPSQPLGLLVVTAAPGALFGTLTAGDRQYPCTVGRGGVDTKGGEGDGITPLGRFGLGRVFFRPDRCAPPATMGLIVAPIHRNDGWCDDPSDGELGV